MKIAISGASGFLGRNLVGVLCNEHTLSFIRKEDIEFRERLESALAAANVFVHLAGVSSVGRCEEDIFSAYTVNSALSGYLAELYFRINPEGHMIFASTAHVYSSTIASPILVNAPVGPGNVYGRSKAAAEKILQQVAVSYGGRLTICRLFNVSHASQDGDYFMLSIYRQISSSDREVTEVVVGNLEIYRDFSPLQDSIEKLREIIDRDCNQPFVDFVNICSGIPLKLNDILKELANQLGREIEIKVDMKKVRKSEQHSIYGIQSSFNLNRIQMSQDEYLKYFIGKFLEQL
ncbi:MAG: NAD-dependent epimerase/dehydratase family protein [Bdellovibrionia bacterium]